VLNLQYFILDTHATPPKVILILEEGYL